MTTWNSAPPPPVHITPAGWLRVVWRGLLMGTVTFLGLCVLLLVRLVEWPLFGQARPVTPWITQAVCRLDLLVLGLPLRVSGKPMRAEGAIVANHSSWLDILVLNAVQRVYFVAKAEVADWAFIGWLARATGTIFIARKGSDAKRQQEIFERRLHAGHRLLFFPEGTSTDAIRVLPFKSTLFQAFFEPALVRSMHIQPVTVVFHAPAGEDARHYGWWGDMDFASHLLKTLSTHRQGRVDIVFHPDVPVDSFENRKSLAQHCERVIRTSHPGAIA